MLTGQTASSFRRWGSCWWQLNLVGGREDIPERKKKGATKQTAKRTMGLESFDTSFAEFTNLASPVVGIVFHASETSVETLCCDHVFVHGSDITS